MNAKLVSGIRRSGLTIYDDLKDHPELLIDHEQLEKILNAELVGLDLDFALRTRSKHFKIAVCKALGYPVPESFKRTQPRFPGQNFDTYIQKADNLQIWNEEVSASRRYVIARVGGEGRLEKIRVVTGEVIAKLDRTGKLTHKYQAKSRSPVTKSALVTRFDTASVIEKLIKNRRADWPGFLAIEIVYRRLKKLIGTCVNDPGRDQERNRGVALQNAVCHQLGMAKWNDDGQFPDVTEQLLEIKLQSAPTIDLGLVFPSHTEPLADTPDFHHCDVRYAVFYGTPITGKVRLDNLVLTTGAGFFDYFRPFGGRVKNSKLQIPLPANFFS